MQISRVGIVTVGIIGLMGLLLAADEPKGESTPASAAKIGADAPDFTLVDCNGKTVKLSDYKDKLVVLDWLNQECPWSVKSVPVIKETFKKYADKGVVWLGVESTHNRKAEDNVQYIKDVELPFTILMDTDGKVGHLYGAQTTPHLYVINKGKLIYMGALNNDQYGKKPKEEQRNYLDEALSAALAGKDVPVAETKSWGCGVKYKDGGKGHGKDKP
jgi:peroxiredoxin